MFGSVGSNPPGGVSEGEVGPEGGELQDLGFAEDAFGTDDAQARADPELAFHRP